MIIKFKNKIPKVDSGCFIAPSADIIGDVTIAKDANIWFNTVVRADGNEVIIGKATNIQDNCTIHIQNKGNPTRIGDYVTIGHGAIIHGCTIGDNCLIGMGAIILNGAVIGENTIVAAGSVVTTKKKIPSGVLCMGTPAKVIRQLTREEINEIKLSAVEYVELSKQYED